MRHRNRQQNQAIEQGNIQVELSESLHSAGYAVPSGPGERLKLARKTLNLSIEEIAAGLRIDRQRIIDIETDNYSNNIAFTFIRGYLRSYAKLVGILPNEIISAFDALALTEVRLPRPLVKQSQSRILKPWSQSWYVAVGVGVVILALFMI